MILVTGGLGFIGPHAARALLDMGESCVLTQWRTSRIPHFIAEEIGKRVVVEQLDLRDQTALHELGTRHEISGIVHLAAYGYSGGDPIEYLQGNSQMLLNVLEAAALWRVRRVCLASTIGVYSGATTSGAVPEDTPTPLAATASLPIPTIKRSAELFANFVTSHAALEVVNMRLSAIWGPLGRDHSPFFAAPALLHAALRGRPLQLPPGQHNGYTEDAVDLCYVKDCARAIALLQTAERLDHHTYNIGCGRATRNREVIAAIHRLLPTASINLPEGRDPAAMADDVWLDISRLQHDTGYEPEYPAERAVVDYADWLRAEERKEADSSGARSAGG
jgi:UDP-glucose 4-epimerase